MAANVLCSALRRLVINSRCNFSWKNYSQKCSAYALMKNDTIVMPENGDIRIKFKPKTFNIDFEIPRNPGIINNIIDLPLTRIPTIQEFPVTVPISIPMNRNERKIDLPPNAAIVDKQAARLIVIRRRKMKKHKRKKLRKRMHYTWLKMKQRRELIKEKAFQAEMEAQLKKAENFDPKQHVSEKLRILTRERLPKTWRGEVLPEAMIRQFMAEKQAKKDAKRNKPRLTLD